MINAVSGGAFTYPVVIMTIKIRTIKRMAMNGLPNMILSISLSSF
jgi:hypothetical protein